MSVGTTFSRDRVWRCALAAILLAASTASSVPPPLNPDSGPRENPIQAPPDQDFPSEGDLISDWTPASRAGVEVRFEGSYLLQRGAYISAPDQPLLRCVRVCVRPRPVNHSECPADCDRDEGGRLSDDGTQHVTQEFASERITLDPQDRSDFERRLGRQALQAKARQFSFSNAFAKFLGEFETWARQSVRVSMRHAPPCSTTRAELRKADYTLLVIGTLYARTGTAVTPLSQPSQLIRIGSVRKFYPEALSNDEPVLNCTCRAPSGDDPGTRPATPGGVEFRYNPSTGEWCTPSGEPVARPASLDERFRYNPSTGEWCAPPESNPETRPATPDERFRYNRTTGEWCTPPVSNPETRPATLDERFRYNRTTGEWCTPPVSNPETRPATPDERFRYNRTTGEWCAPPVSNPETRPATLDERFKYNPTTGEWCAPERPPDKFTFRRDKSAPVKDDELDDIEPRLSLVTDSGFEPIALTNATTTTAVQRLVAERVEIGARTNVAGQHRRLWRGDVAELWPSVEAALTGRWMRTGPVALPNLGAARRPIPTRVASLAWIPSPPPQDAESIRASLVATGRASGEVFRLEVSNPSAEALHLVAPDGLVLEPIKPGAGSPVSATARDLVQRYPVAGYCLDFAKPPPVAGMLFRIAPRAVQEQFRPLRAVLRAGRQLADAGRLHPDSNPQAYGEFVRQWTVWTQIEKWDERQFTERFTARTRETARQLKRPWTQAMEAQLRAAAPNRWRDISAVLEEAKALEAVRP